MKVTEHLANAKKPLVSVEIIPPKRGGNLQQIYDAINSIKHYEPAFIDVTSHAAEVMWEEQKDGKFKKKVRRKSPGTFGLCAMIKYRFNIDPVPHLLCGGFSKEETEDALIELNYLGIENILAIRGDKVAHRDIPNDRHINRYALDLVQQIHDMNHGTYLDELIDAQPTNFCVGVAYYPEKHFQAPNLNFDLDILKKKVAAGADYGASQMFFDTQKYIDFCNKAKSEGINIPLIPGMKILTGKKQLAVLPEIFRLDIPQELTERMLAAKTREQEIEVGVEWTYRQCLELLEFGVPCLHFYIMQNTKPFLMLMDKLNKQL
ncbi:MAG: methylenetetrahydrofolate reductase [Bacteroidia bacterium]